MNRKHCLTAVLLLTGVIALVAQERVMTIDQLFTLADQQNRDISVADVKVAVARQGEAVAKNARLPQINASLTLSYLGDGTIIDRNFSHAMRDPLPHFSNALAVELYQPLFTGGAVTAGIEMAAKGKDMAVNDRQRTVNAVRMALVTNYLQLAKNRNLLQVYDENIALTEKLLKQMSARYTQGVVLKNDVVRYELRLSSLKYDRLSTANAIKIFNDNLVSMLGLEPASEIVPVIDVDADIMMDTDESTWVNTAAAVSPAIKALGLSMDMQRSGRRLTHSEYIPKIGLIAGDKLAGPVTFEVPAINKNYNAWFVGINVKWNVSSLFTTAKATRKHDLELLRINDEKEAAMTEIERHINEALTLYRQSVDRLEIERKNVQLAEENYTVVSHRFDNQLALLTDMLDASNARLDAGVRLVNAEISIRYYYYQLHYLAGTLTTL